MPYNKDTLTGKEFKDSRKPGLNQPEQQSRRGVTVIYPYPVFVTIAKLYPGNVYRHIERECTIMESKNGHPYVSLDDLKILLNDYFKNQ